jgi:superfamily II DNA or RNA helicase
MPTTLWPHQLQAIQAVTAGLNQGRQAGLLEMPTGTGKTLTFLTLAHGSGQPSLVLVHREELLAQTIRAAREFWDPTQIGCIHGRCDAWSGRLLVVASLPSLHAGRRSSLPQDYFGLIVVDECHHLAAPSWQQTVAHFQPTFLLGVTATPDRLDGQGLAPWFGPQPLYRYTLRQAIEDGHLVRLRQFAIETRINLDGVAIRAGDFATGELGKAVATQARNRAIVEAYQHHAADRKAIAFAVDITHAEMLQEAFTAEGIAAVAVVGTMPRQQRRQALADFAAGKFQVLVNCEICTEGYDERTIACVLMARPTQSRALYQQCVGRGLRLCPEIGKQDCLVLDFVDNCRRHPLVTAPDLFGVPDRVDAAGRDVLAVADEEASSVQQPQPEKVSMPLSRRLLDAVEWQSEEVHPWRDLEALADYRPTLPWHRHPATSKQLKLLERLGVRPPARLTKGAASHLIAWHIQESG